MVVFRLIGGSIRLVLFIIGLLLVIIGALLAMTFIGAIIGVPLLLLGLGLIVLSFSFRRRRKVQEVRIHNYSGKTVDVKGKRVK